MLKPLIPKINWNNQITKGIVFDAPLFERGGTTTLDIANEISGTIASSGATWDTNFYGTDLDFSAAASRVAYTTPSRVNSLTQVSWETLVYFRSTGGGTLGRVFQKKSGTAPYFELITQTTNQFSAQYGWGSANAATNYTAALNQWWHLIGTYDFSNVNNIPLLYVNGTLAITGTAGSGTAVSDDANLYIGNRSDSVRNFDGKIVYVRIWNRILNAQEAKQLYTNPFQIYIRPPYQGFNSISSAKYYSFLTTLGAM